MSHRFSFPCQRGVLESLPESHIARSFRGRSVLLAASREAAQNAHAPESGFPVGAALMTWDGGLHVGGNIELPAQETPHCGERAAIWDAVTCGAARARPDFVQAIAVSCVKAPSPYERHLNHPAARAFDRALYAHVKAQEGALQIPFAGFAGGWLSESFTQTAIGNGMPCGACRQTIAEFAGPHTVIIVDDGRDGIVFNFAHVMPLPFNFGFAPMAGAVADTPGLEARARADGSAGLRALAQEAIANAHAWQGAVRSGAMLIAQDGRAVAGVSVLNASTGLGVNALRTAITRGVARGLVHACGERFVREAAVFYDTDGPVDALRAAQPDLAERFFATDAVIHVGTRRGYTSLAYDSLRARAAGFSCV